MPSVLSWLEYKSGLALRAGLAGLTMVVTALVTQMNDAGRLRIIDETGSSIDRNYRDLTQFSQESFLLSMQRAQDENDVAATKALYGMAP